MSTDLMSTFDICLISNTFVSITPVRAISTGPNLGNFGTT